jgi:hypothetical protein
MRRGRPGGALLWAGALVVLLVLAACTAAAAAAVTITRRQQQHRHPAPASSSAARGCDAFAAGRWVVDGSYPLYDSASCPFIRDEFACARFGRPDTMYLKYRWQLDPPCAQPRYVNKELTSSCRSFLSLFFYRKIGVVIVIITPWRTRGVFMVERDRLWLRLRLLVAADRCEFFFFF